MTLRAPIGISDFRKLRESGADYVDKTSLIVDVLEEPTEVLLFPRPRRFGKTLNLSTLRHFFEKSGEDLSALFTGLAVWDSPRARAHFQRHPVISLTFKDVKERTAADWASRMRSVVAEEYRRHRHLLDGGLLDREERAYFERVLASELAPVELQDALGYLSRYLARATGEKVVILVDEYDTPIHAGYARGYYDEVVGFFRNFLSAGLKDNPHLFKGVLTGILRVARESIFSGLNNLAVYSLLSSRFATAFGFTDIEVQRLAEAAGLVDRMDGIREHYNGYLFGGEVIYNPWSVLNYLANPADDFKAYWVATSSDDLIRDLLTRAESGGRADLETLLRGGIVERPIDENIVLRDVAQRPDALWSFLLFSGYLKATARRRDESGDWICALAIPNREVRSTFHKVFRVWMEVALGGSDGVSALRRALLMGDAENFERLLEEMMLHVLSVQDLGGRTPERVYQAFILGLLAELMPRYEVRSNRESGHGRFDVLVSPRDPGEPGVVLELKVLDARRNETVEHALDSALRQIAERDYAADLRARGIHPIHEMAAVFDGKRAWVRRRPE